jgi:hypothetical protein
VNLTLAVNNPALPNVTLGERASPFTNQSKEQEGLRKESNNSIHSSNSPRLEEYLDQRMMLLLEEAEKRGNGSMGNEAHRNNSIINSPVMYGKQKELFNNVPKLSATAPLPGTDAILRVPSNRLKKKGKFTLNNVHRGRTLTFRDDQLLDERDEDQSRQLLRAKRANYAGASSSNLNPLPSHSYPFWATSKPKAVTEPSRGVSSSTTVPTTKSTPSSSSRSYSYSNNNNKVEDNNNKNNHYPGGTKPPHYVSSLVPKNAEGDDNVMIPSRTELPPSSTIRVSVSATTGGESGNRLRESSSSSFTSLYSSSSVITTSSSFDGFNDESVQSKECSNNTHGLVQSERANWCPDVPHYVVYSWILCMVSLAAFLKLYFLFKAAIILVMATTYILLIFFPFQHLFVQEMSRSDVGSLVR